MIYATAVLDLKVVRWKAREEPGIAPPDGEWSDS
jgi:hypothetical protein